LESLVQNGYVRAMIDGVMTRLDEEIELSKTKKHTIKVVIDRLIINPQNKDRIAQDVERALKQSKMLNEHSNKVTERWRLIF